MQQLHRPLQFFYIAKQSACAIYILVCIVLNAEPPSSLVRYSRSLEHREEIALH
jgi:hypothetical protein